MYLVGIHEHEFARGEGVAFFIDIEFQFAFKEREDLDGSVPVLFTHIAAVFSFEYEHLKWYVVVGDDDLV